MISTVERGTVEVQGASLYYEVIGEGAPLVLLHGFSFDSSLWDGQVEEFAKTYRVLRYDLRGFGRSNADAVPYSHARDLKALLEKLEIRDPLLIGSSLGGGAVLNFAITFPGIAKAIVLAAPSLGGFQWSANVVSAQTSMLQRVREKGIDTARAIWLRQMIFRHAMKNAPVAARIRSMAERYSGWHWTHADLGIPMKPPAIERLGEIHVPTLVLVGDADASDHLQIAEILERGIPGARKIVIPDVGHLVNLETPGLFNRQVLEFLDGTQKHKKRLHLPGSKHSPEH